MSKDIKYTSDYRDEPDKWYTTGNERPYDWKRYGVIGRISPGFLMRSNNPLLTALMKFIDMWALTLLMSIEKINRFKDFMHK